MSDKSLSSRRVIFEKSTVGGTYPCTLRRLVEHEKIIQDCYVLVTPVRLFSRTSNAA